MPSTFAEKTVKEYVHFQKELRDAKFSCRKRTYKMRMTMRKKNLIVIPAYNESGNIERTVQDVLNHAPNFDYVVINDCSKDNTLHILKKNHMNYLNLPVNLGIGGAVQTGYRYAYYHGYQTAVQFDGDGQHDAKYLQTMLDELENSKADMVIGSRFIAHEGFQSSTLRRVGIRYFTNLIKMLTKVTITDPTSGLRMVNRKLMKEFAFNYPNDYPEPESVVRILKDGYTVKEIPVEMRARLEGKSSINLKSGLYYMVKVSFAILVARFSR